MAKLTQAQLDEIQTTQESRGLTRKSAVQFCTRKWKKEVAAQPKAVAAPQPQVEVAKPTRKAAAPKPGMPDVVGAPALPDKPTHHFTLAPVPDVKHTFTTTVHGRKSIVAYIERDRTAAAKRFNSLTMRDARVKAAQKAAKDLGLPLYYAAMVKVQGRWDSGWLITAQTAQVFVVASADFQLSTRARIAFAADAQSYAGGCKFDVEEAK